MSITSAMFTGISGLLANAEGINVIGNNISNVNTVGFKTGRMNFADMLSVSAPNASQIGLGTKIQKIDNMFTQSTFETTGNATDVAIQGEAFFVLGTAPVTTSAGFVAPADAANVNLTRAGAFRLISDAATADTYILVNPEGYPVLDSTTGGLITVAKNLASPAGTGVEITKIGTDGTITAYDSTGAAAVVTGKIGTVNVTDKTKVSKIGGTMFKADATAWNTVPTNASFNAVNGSTQQILQSSLEQSNVDMASQFVKMILTQRAYSANSKTISTADEMTQEVLNMKR